MDALTSFADERLEFLNRPDNDDSVRVSADGSTLTLLPAAERDFWARTFYRPLLVKADALAAVCPVPAAEEATLSVGFTLAPKSQFDQAGAFIFVDDDCWVKAGIEYVDKVPRLSVVVTNSGFSDWSTQLLPFVALRLRVSKLAPGDAQGPALLVEASPYEEGADADAPGDWQFVRIASLRSGDRPWRMGAYAASPVAQKGCTAIFHYMRIGARMEPSHAAEL